MIPAHCFIICFEYFLFDHDNGYALSIRAFTGTCVCLAFGDVTMQCFEYQKSATQLYCL